MTTAFQSIVNELNTVLVQLRTGLRGLQTDADGAGIAIVTFFMACVFGEMRTQKTGAR